MLANKKDTGDLAARQPLLAFWQPILDRGLIGNLLPTNTRPHAENNVSYVPARLDWIDAARAICIILVIIGHTIGGFRDAHLIPEEGTLSHIFYLIYTFHMPAFLILSGLLSSRSIHIHPEKFANNLVIKIAYPYFLWGSIQILIMGQFGNFLNHPMHFNPGEFLKLIWGNVSQFWFLKVLFLLHVMHFIFKKYLDDIFFLGLCFALRGCAEFVPLPETAMQLCNLGIFYALGVMFSEKLLEWPLHYRVRYLWVGVLGITWTVLAIAALKENPSMTPDGQPHALILLCSLTGSLFVFAVCGLKYTQHLRSLLYIGQHALPIFLLHVLFVAGARIFFVKIAGAQEVTIILPIAILAGLLGPLVIRKFAENFRLHRALGLG